MMRLRFGYLISGIVTGLLLLINFWITIPSGNLKIVVCEVGQGDATYVRFPDGRDLLIDGGPNDRVIDCLSRAMPFWDRTIDMIALTHPQKDHLMGLISVLKRYKITYFLRSDVAENSEAFLSLKKLIVEKNVPEKLVTTGEKISIGETEISVLWPSDNLVTKLQGNSLIPVTVNDIKTTTTVLGKSTTDINEGSIVFTLHYGNFDALFMGDADEHVDGELPRIFSEDGMIEFLKVPHHGAKTAMTDSFITKLYSRQKTSPAKAGLENWENCHMGDGISDCPPVAVISVGKNSYGHPAPELVQKFKDKGVMVKQTDQDGDITVISDGKTWSVESKKR